MPANTLPDPAELYETFYGPAIFAPLADALLAFADPRPGERVLDLACGTGIVARAAAARVAPDGSVVGVDLNPSMLAVARAAASAAGTTVEWREGDATALELPAGAFDVAVCQQGLQFFSDRLAALRSVRRALAPGGRLALALWQGVEHQPLFAGFAEVEARHLAPLGIPHEALLAPFSLGDSAAIRAILEESGFDSIRLAPHTVEAVFPAAGFARKMETAYAAVVPEFVEDPAAFEEYVEAVERGTSDVVRRFTEGDVVRIGMPAHLVLARC
jgi:ubiquinone/menaquinone biosynthesis C-methylase UbiE